MEYTYIKMTWPSCSMYAVGRLLVPSFTAGCGKVPHRGNTAGCGLLAQMVHSVLWCDLGCSSRTVVLVKAAMNPRQRLFYVDWVAV